MSGLASAGLSGDDTGEAVADGLPGVEGLGPPVVGLVGSSLLPLVRRFRLRGSRFVLAAVRASMKKSLSWRPAAGGDTNHTRVSHQSKSERSRPIQFASTQKGKGRGSNWGELPGKFNAASRTCNIKNHTVRQ